MSASDGSHSSGEPDPKLMTLVQQSEALVSLLQGFFTQLNNNRMQDFAAITDSIARAKHDIHDLRPQSISIERLPSAGAELNAITQDTEGATNVIMSAAEVILDLDHSDVYLKDRIDDEVMKMFEACSFQDITGQRVSKIVRVLSQIEERVTRLAISIGSDECTDEPSSIVLTPWEKRQRDLLLNGPAIGGPEVSQAAVDDIFDNLDQALALD